MFESKAERAKALKREEYAEDAAENRSDRLAEDREESAKLTEKAIPKAPAPFNPPVVRQLFPRWVVAKIPDVGEASVLVQSESEESLVKAGRASFGVTKSAQGDTYYIV